MVGYPAFFSVSLQNVNKLCFSKKVTQIISSKLIVQRAKMIFLCKIMIIPVSLTHVTITPWRSSYQLGEVLTCSADGNPAPTYEWKDLATGGEYKGPTVSVIQSVNSSRNSTYRCTATNIVAGKTNIHSKDITFTVGGKVENMSAS